MADQILGSIKALRADTTICHWEFRYIVESNDQINQFCIRVTDDEMDDPTDEAEAKTKANVKAKAIKDAWVANLSTVPNNVAVITSPEDVTLA